jgi:FlaA1/EpsC-like NDP-sugar epimerase
MAKLNRIITNVYLKAAAVGHRTLVIVLVEACMIVVSAALSFVLRLNHLPNGSQFLAGIVLLVSVRMVFLWRYNLLRGWWRYTGFDEALDLAKATGLGTAVFFLLYSIVVRIAGSGFGWPVSVYFIEALLTAAFLAAGRATSRKAANLSGRLDRIASTRLLLVGAGDAGRRLLKELNRKGSGFRAVACVDDDSTKQGIPFEGSKVEGTLEDIPEIARRFDAQEIWIAMPRATSSQMNRIVKICAETQLPFKSMPRFADIVNGNLVPQVRQVSTSDLLGRDPITADLKSVRDHIEGKRVMVTGAAGSIGSELCWQLLGYAPKELVCLDQSETGIFYLELKQRDRACSLPVSYCVADVSNAQRMRRIIHEHQIEIIFHAAAYKHVPVMETNVSEAVYNNITAFERLLDTAEDCGVESFVMISSDKAVNPTNVMGTTKRIAELVIASRPSPKMECVAVRFGNVLGSNGSVVPIFQEQISRDNEITITHPDIKRFFMTIDEAVSLVLQAFTVGTNGDILVLDMGEPMKIVDLARNLIRLSGKTEKDVQIRFVGLRNGEKLKEELFYESEQVWQTSCHKVLRTRSTVRRWPELSRLLKALALLVETGSDEELKFAMKAIVPEYDVQELNAPGYPTRRDSYKTKSAAAPNASTSIQ